MHASSERKIDKRRFKLSISFFVFFAEVKKVSESERVCVCVCVSEYCFALCKKLRKGIWKRQRDDLHFIERE
jgi:hypothetical protein